MRQREGIYIGVISLVVGIVIGGAISVLSVNGGNQELMKMMGVDTSRMKANATGHMGMSMEDMSNELRNRSGDDFDENFIAMMIAHHQGAIDMAELSQARAKHDEVKQLGRDIITTQAKEIETMRSWQSSWGYDAAGSGDKMHRMQ